MNFALRLFVMIMGVLVFAIVINLLVKKRMNESNSISWLLIAFATLIFGFFPSLLAKMSALLGIDYAPSLLFLASILLLMIIAFRSSIQFSEMDAKINELAITLSILKEENNRLVSRLNEIDAFEKRDE